MKLSYLIKLIGVSTALSLFSFHSLYAECPCGHDDVDVEQQQEEDEINNANPDNANS